jgi:hypothetical protein
MRVADWIATFMGRWSASKKIPESVSSEDVADPQIKVDRERFLESLEELKVQAPEAYLHVVEHLKGQLANVRRVKLWTAAHSRDFICNAEIARDAKCRALESFIYDLEHTKQGQERTASEAMSDVMPAGVRS